jgi:hypothetical protein
MRSPYEFVGGVVREDGGRAGGEGVEGGSPRSRQRFRLLHTPTPRSARSGLRPNAGRQGATRKRQGVLCALQPCLAPI